MQVSEKPQHTPAIGPYFLWKPTESDIKRVADSIPSKPFNFEHVGCTKTAPPLQGPIKKEPWWVENRTQVRLGTGRHTFNKCVTALKNWHHFDLGWAFVNKAPVKKDKGVVVTAQSLFVWSCNPLKVTYVENKSGRCLQGNSSSSQGQRFSFGHTTLQGHQLAGEEKFSLEWRKADDSVWYEVYSVSKPATPVAWLAQPLVRLYQWKFAQNSMKKMKQLTTEVDGL